MEYQVRPARITDVDRLVALAGAELDSADRDAPLMAADLLRQLVYLPQASVVVAEARRGLVGGAVLALRPSVRSGGYVGTVDLLVVDPDHDPDDVTDVLLEECLRSAGNKGCRLVEARRPDDPIALDRWARRGFVVAGPQIERTVSAPHGAGSGRSSKTLEGTDQWARTSPSSWTSRTSSMRPRPRAWTSTTSRSSSRRPRVATSCVRTPIPASTPRTRTSGTSTRSSPATTTRS